MMKLKVSEVCDPPVERIFETTQGTRLTLPPKMDENSYITDINFIKFRTSRVCESFSVNRY